MEKTCAFTGNRPEKLPWQYNESDPRCVRAKQEIANRVREAVRDGYVRFISGMAQGGDVFFAESVLALKDENPSVTLECAVPYLGQASRWSGEYRLRYDDILKRADKITVLSDDYTPWCMHVRNRYRWTTVRGSSRSTTAKAAARSTLLSTQKAKIKKS